MGLSVGGAKDAANFRVNVARGFMPQPSDISCEGVFYDYAFSVEPKTPCAQLVCPAYATASLPDPFTGRLEHYLAVGLSTNTDRGAFARKPLNLVVVLDVSSSMSAPFNAYYYDGSKGREVSDDKTVTKIEAARQAVSSLLDRLGPKDRFGLVLFNSRAE